jgi:molybdenum cofactor guanylyltransferase
MTPRVAAIVLAGGRSSRFGRNKLREPIDGQPLLHRAIAAVRLVADEVIVVGGVDDTRPPSDAAPHPHGIRVIHDERPFEGPLAALAIALVGTDADLVIVVGGDMPSLVPAVLARLVAALDDPATDAAVLDDAGHHRPLPMALRRATAAPVATGLIDRGERRLRSLRDALGFVVIPDTVWREDDPAGATLRDIDTPDDLR